MSIKNLEWSDKFSTDIVSVDRQHQELLSLSQALIDLLGDASASSQDKADAFQNLVDHALAHFAYEERIMQNIRYPHLPRHIREHDELRAEIAHLREMVLNGEGPDDWKGLVSMVQVWVLRHIVASDTLIRAYIQHDPGDDEEE